ncbi:MAG: 6-bladed beta-propeller [Bacteroidales bacterium]
MSKIFSVLIIIIALTLACNSNQESDVITLNDDGVPVISIERITKTGEMKFTDLVTDFEIIRLETSEECLIDYIARSYVSDKYIIISTVWNGILLFSRDGSFVRTIALHGNGPGEVSDPNRNIELDEFNNKLYVTNQMSLTPELLCLNIEKGGYENIPMATDNRLRNMYVSNDSILTISTMPAISDASDNPVFAQTTSGSLLWKIKHTNRNGATNGELTRVGDQLFFNYIWGDDTLFILDNEELIPHTIFYSDRHNYLPHIQESPGDITSGFRVLNDEFISGSYSILTGFSKQNNSNRERPEFESGKRFIYNMKKKEAFIIDRIEDDILGSGKGFSQPQKNGIFAIHFTPVEILKLAERIKNDSNVSDEISERLLDLSSRINEDDNPVMLIGKMK